MRCKNDQSSYIFNNFQVEHYGTDEIQSYDPSKLSRFRNLIYKAFNKFNRLPKYIVIIFEEDLVNATDYNDFGLADIYQQLLEWIIKEYHRSVITIKDRLPNKAARMHQPHIIFIAPSVHRNYKNDNKRRKFTLALEKAARESRNFLDMSTYRLRKQWDPEDNMLVSRALHKMTETGLRAFWTSVEKTVRYCDMKLNEKQETEKRNQWMEETIQSEQLRLPPPPPFSTFTNNGGNTVRSDRYHYYKH